MSRWLPLIGVVAFLGFGNLRATSGSPPIDLGSLPNKVASGDTTQTSTVLWARSNVPGRIFFVVARDPGFHSMVRVASREVTDPGLPVKVNLADLTPGTEYSYLAIDSARNIARGRFATPAGDGVYAGLRFGVSGDWRGELRPYPAVANADERDLDFFVLLGDTIYADVRSDAVKNPDGSRKAQAETLQEFRAKHDEVYGTRFGFNTLADLRSSTSVFATIDDHEVTNDFAGGAPPASDPRFAGFPGAFINDTPLYENGVQAFQEFNPVRDLFYGATGDPRTAEERKLYRFRTFGKDAAVFVLDARSFRDTELTPFTGILADAGRFIVQAFDPRRTMLGAAQRQDLKSDLWRAHERGVTWKFVVVPEPIQNLGVVAAQDRFEGYAAERTEVLRFINQNAIPNVVFISADVHGTIVNNLTYQEGPFGRQIRTSAFEVVTGAVAFDAPFGPTVINLAQGLGLIAEVQRAFYDRLPVAGDKDDILNDKDDVLKALIDSQTAPFGYDPVGLNDSLIPAKLLHGDYIAVHTYGWTEFEINARNQELLVTTYGIKPYTEAELLAAPRVITTRVPAIVSQFSVTPVH